VNERHTLVIFVSLSTHVIAYQHSDVSQYIKIYPIHCDNNSNMVQCIKVDSFITPSHIFNVNSSSSSHKDLTVGASAFFSEIGKLH